MNLREWLMSLWRSRSEPHGPDPVKQKLTARQEGVADRLAAMRGTTRDEVLAEAYRRADRILSGRTRGNG